MRKSALVSALSLFILTAACRPAQDAEKQNTPIPDDPVADPIPWEGRLEIYPESGFFSEPFELEIRAFDRAGLPLKEFEILCSNDGSDPQDGGDEKLKGDVIALERSAVLRFRLKLGDQLSEVHTRSYFFPPDILEQSENPRDLPETWGIHEGEPVRADYGMDQEILGRPEYRRRAESALRQLPSISIALAPSALFDVETGIYANPLNRGREWERRASLEFIPAEGSEEAGFGVDAGLRIHGYYSRIPTKSAKHSLRLKFRGDYGAKKLEHPIFPTTDIARFETLVLRALVNDSVMMDQEKAQYLRDDWVWETERILGLEGAHRRYVHLFLNGMYWGLYSISERLDADWAESHLGGDADEYDIIKNDEALDGDLEAWQILLADAEEGLKSDEAFAAFSERLDISAFIDHWIVAQFAARSDWPSANWVAVSRRGERFIFPSWDAEASMLTIDLDKSKSAVDGTYAQLYARLRRNSEFQSQFANRAEELLSEGGLLYAAGAEEGDRSKSGGGPAADRYLELADQIEDSIVLEAARWGDWLDPDAPAYLPDDSWYGARDFVAYEFFPKRRLVLIEQLRERGLYPEEN